MLDRDLHSIEMTIPTLCAAIYAAKDIVLLDDIFSSLDAKIGRHVFDHAICGLLATTTRILVTNQVRNCSGRYRTVS
jgi:ABC-type nitrate/sulfonate/bicarbonate transport system ATPase subunit